jgi:hypothetical protein
VTDSRLPVGFTITPYNGKATAITPYDGQATAGPTPWAWARRALLQFGSRVIAAGLALAAAWAPVLQVTEPAPNPDGADDGFLRYSLNGWGHGTARTSLGIASDSISGTNFGVLLCTAAAGLVFAAVADRLPRRPRWQPSGRTVAALAIAFLLAVVLCEVVTSLPSRRAAQQGDGYAFHFGLSPWLGGAACLIAALSCLSPPTQTASPETDDAFRRK